MQEIVLSACQSTVLLSQVIVQLSTTCQVSLLPFHHCLAKLSCSLDAIPAPFCRHVTYYAIGLLQSTPGQTNTRWTGRQPRQEKWKELLEETSARSLAHPPRTASIHLGLWVGHQSLLAPSTEQILTPYFSYLITHFLPPLNTTLVIIVTSLPTILTPFDSH